MRLGSSSSRARNTLTLKNVLLGEVWICSGQSNMSRPLSGADAQDTNYPDIRIFNTGEGMTPREHDCNEPWGWSVSSPETVAACGDMDRTKHKNFTEVGYTFGRAIYKAC